MALHLYCFGESGNAYKAALALELAGLRWEPVFVDFFNGAARTADYRETVNEMGEVPVLIDTETGLRLTQSGLIQDWVAETTGRFGPGTPAERREILRWTFWENLKLSGTAGPVRFLRNFLPEDRRPAEVIAFLEGRLAAALAILERHLERQEWVAADRPTTADFACCGYLYYPEPFGFERGNWPHIAAWLDRIAALPGWKHPYDLMPGHPSDRA